VLPRTTTDPGVEPFVLIQTNPPYFMDNPENLEGRDASPSRSEPTDLDKPEVGRWLTVTEAAKAAGTDRGTISRAVDHEKLKSNGKSDRNRRIDAIDLIRWMLERSKRDVPETEEGVKESMRKAGFANRD
jgi:hypothetical protein